MANFRDNRLSSSQPLILAIPGEEHSGASRQLAGPGGELPGCRLLELGMWDNPHRNTWINRLNLAIHRANQPVVLVADGLACLSVIWWAEYEQAALGSPVIGAVLVSPPDVDRPGSDSRLARFGSYPGQPLPFQSFVVATGNEPHELLRTYRRISAEWDCHYVDSREADDPAGSRSSPLIERLVRQLLRWQAVQGEQSPVLQWRTHARPGVAHVRSEG